MAGFIAAGANHKMKMSEQLSKKLNPQLTNYILT